jgi:hypothetical protein
LVNACEKGKHKNLQVDASARGKEEEPSVRRRTRKRLRQDFSLFAYLFPFVALPCALVCGECMRKNFSEKISFLFGSSP